MARPVWQGRALISGGDDERSRELNRVLAARIDQLRHLNTYDVSHSYLLAPELMNGATDLASAGHVDEALELLAELVGYLEAWPEGRRDNALVAALGMTGGLQLRQGRSEEAEPVLRRAVALVSEDVPAHLAAHHAAWRGGNLVHLARCRELAGDPDEALTLV